MTFYLSIQAIASDLLAQFGQSLTIRRQTAEVYDPESGSVMISTPVSLQTLGIFQSINKNLFSNIEVGDRQVALSAAIEPLQGDELLIGGDAWAISEISAAAPAGVPLVYFARVRR
jgi:hypothetical protein